MKPDQGNIKKPFNRLSILLAAGLLLALFVSFAAVQLSRSRRDLVSMLDEEGFVLLNALTASGERSILAYEELEYLVQLRLLNNADWIEQSDYQHGLNRIWLDNALKRMDLFRIHILNETGSVMLSSTPPSQNTAPFDREIFHDIVSHFAQTPGADSLVVGFRQGQNNIGPRFAVAVRRRKGGVVVVVADAQRLLLFRKELGPGRLIQDISNQPGIEYIALQDSLGIVLASRNVSGLSRIEADPFLKNLTRASSSGSRFQTFEGKTVYEIVGGFAIEGENLGLFRIGLSTAHYQRLIKNARWRLFFIVLLFMFIGIAGLGLLITRQNNRLLSESVHRVKTHTGEILQNMEDAVIVINASAVVTMYNEAASRLFGVPRDEALGRPVSSLNVSSLSILNDVLISGLPIDRQKESLQTTGGNRILSLRTSILYDSNQKIENVILVATDLTAQTSLEEELRQQEKLNAMGKLASGVAHEIRNPINAIGMIAQRFLKEFKPSADEDEYYELAETIVQETRRSDAIIRRFLDFARPADLVLSLSGIDGLLHETAALLRSRAEAKGVLIETGSIASAELQIDRDQIKQVLINVMQNSMDAVEAGGSISLSGVKRHQEYIIQVVDTGRGIPQAVMEKIFDLYYTTKQEGLGMGLSIAYQIIQRHNGLFHVESREGEGATVTITLPTP